MRGVQLDSELLMDFEYTVFAIILNLALFQSPWLESLLLKKGPSQIEDQINFAARKYEEDEQGNE